MMEYRKLSEDLKLLVQNQIRHGTFKNLEDQLVESVETEEQSCQIDQNVNASDVVESGRQVSDARTIKNLMKDLLTVMEPDIARLDEKLKGKRAEQNLQQVTESALSHMKSSTEQIQQHIEIYEDISIKSLPLTELYDTIKQLTKIDVTTQGIQFRTEWKAYNLLYLTHMLLLLKEYKTAKESGKYVIFWLQQNIGAEARLTSLHGFSSHILAVIHRIQKSYETSSQYYDSACSAYQGDCNWKDLQAKKILIDVASLKLEQTKRRVNFAEATIGPEGGSMSINSCQVQFPEGALSGRRDFVLTTSLVENVEEEYAPISAVLECEPPTNFKSAVKIAIPIWCEVKDDKVTAQVFCLDSTSPKRELIQTINLQSDQNEISFDCKHFSSFYLMIKRSLFRKLKFKVALNIWKSPEGNFILVLAVKDKTVERKWQNDLQEQGYSPTKAVLNPIVIKNKVELQITMTCLNGHFLPNGSRRFVPNFFHNPYYYQTFVLNEEDTDKQESKTLTCMVGFQKKILEEVTWRETNIKKSTATFEKTGDTRQEVNVQRPMSHTDSLRRRLADVFQDEMVREFPSRPMSHTEDSSRERLADVFQDEIVMEFQSRQLWRRFAISCHGLTLSSIDVDDIEANHPGDLERQKLTMLKLWKDRTGGNESSLVIQIRNTVASFRQHEHTRNM